MTNRVRLFGAVALFMIFSILALPMILVIKWHLDRNKTGLDIKVDQRTLTLKQNGQVQQIPLNKLQEVSWKLVAKPTHVKHQVQRTATFLVHTRDGRTLEYADLGLDLNGGNNPGNEELDWLRDSINTWALLAIEAGDETDIPEQLLRLKSELQGQRQEA